MQSCVCIIYTYMSNGQYSRFLGMKRGNAVRRRNRAQSPKSDRIPPKATQLNLRRSHDCVLADLLKSDTFFHPTQEPPKSDRTPPSCPWQRVMQGVSANAHMIYTHLNYLSNYNVYICT